MGENVLVIGSGGREHALAWKLSLSPHVSRVYSAPGNPGIAAEKKCEIIPVNFGDIKNFKACYDFVKEKNIGMVVVGPEAPLAAGIVDYMNSFGYNRIFGPTKAASILEASKIESFKLMRDANIPQARGMECYSVEDMRKATEEVGTEFGVVFKADGLTGGKGVSVYDSIEQALKEAEGFFATYKKFGKGILVAERLSGQEISVHAFCDGKRASALEIAVQDHKPLLDGDKGPNTGGMGAYCPVPIAPREVIKWVEENAMTPAVLEMAKRGTPYMGFLYAGMMMTKEGPKVLEFNIRMGDPECQPAMMLLESDLYEHISDSLDGKLEQKRIRFNPGAACCVVHASHGYPGKYKKGIPIRLKEAERVNGVKIFHAGTSLDEKGNLVSSGGRVLSVTAKSSSLEEAQAIAYFASEKIGGFYYRTDIGEKALV